MSAHTSGPMPEQQASLSGTRDAVESAFDLAKRGLEGTWEQLARLLPKRILKWGAPTSDPPTVNRDDDCQ